MAVHFLFRLSSVMILLVVILSISITLGATTYADSPDPDSPLFQDAQQYATQFEVDVQTAIERLNLSKLAGDLDAELSEKEPEIFAGLWIEHRPDFRFVVLLTAGDKTTIEPYLTSEPLWNLVEVRHAEVTLKQLVENQRVAVRQLKSLKVPVDSVINVFNNNVELHVAEIEQFYTLSQSNLRLPDHVQVIKVDNLLVPAVNMYAGLGINGCTSGFSVRNTSTGVLGILTAGHCLNSQSYSGTNLPFVQEILTGSRDVQWHTAPGFTITNWAQDDTCCDGTPYYRLINATKKRGNQSIGEFVCKYGKVTGYNCGNIVQKNVIPNWVPNAEATFIGVDGPVGQVTVYNGPVGQVTVLGGDSGGPWYVGGTAYGITSGGNNANYAVYMAINFAKALGVNVLTQ